MGPALAARLLPGGNPMLAAKGRRFATARAIFRGYHRAIPLTVAYSSQLARSTRGIG